MELALTEYTRVIDLHGLDSGEAEVLSTEGGCFRVQRNGELGAPIGRGDTIKVGEAIYVMADASLTSGEMTLTGGRAGRAHAFATPAAMQCSPSKKDVPRLMRDLEHLEERVVQHFGEDPLASEDGPSTPYEHAVASEYALMNLTLDAAMSLPENLARSMRAVCLFFTGDAACVAMSAVSVRKIRALMEALDRPVNPHVVAANTLHTLLDSVYGTPGNTGAS